MYLRHFCGLKLLKIDGMCKFESLQNYKGRLLKLAMMLELVLFSCRQNFSFLIELARMQCIGLW